MSCRERIEVGLGDRAYPIWIGEGILAELGGLLDQLSFPRRIALITNPLVGGLYGDMVMQSLYAAGYAAVRIDIPDGEEAKHLGTVSGVYDALLENGLDRGCGIVALGGGVVGDLAGFAAATFLRGIPFIQVPTTLLAQVDSSVGGKTGVNHPQGKNLIGAFWQPQLVLADVAVLGTLSQRDFVSGLAEVVKYGVIQDRPFFDWLVEHRAPLLKRDPAALTYAIKRSCQIKADIVERDERESALRAVLNFGHTFGHAVENLSGYGEYLHGEAVAIGMVVAAQIARKLGLCTVTEVSALRQLLVDLSLPVEAPEFEADELYAVLCRDKKVHAGVLRMVLNRGIGACEIRAVDDPKTLFREVLSRH